MGAARISVEDRLRRGRVGREAFCRHESATGLEKSGRVADASGQTVSTEPFTSSRDKFVLEMRDRVDAMDKALDNVKATGPRKTELNESARPVNKLGEDIDRLKTATSGRLVGPVEDSCQ